MIENHSEVACISAEIPAAQRAALEERARANDRSDRKAEEGREEA
jgi:hypothetical protein